MWYKLLATTLVTMLTQQAFATAPGGMEIRYVDANGSGCPAGTAMIDVSPDKQVFTAIFSSFQAQVGPGISLVEKNKSCLMTVNVKVPPGWQYSIFKAQYDGWYDLGPGVALTQTSRYWFQGGERFAASSRYTGPRTGTFSYPDEMGVSSWSPCGGTRNMVISANLALDNSRNRQSSGVAGIDSIEGQFKLMYHYYIAYRQCN